MASHDFRDVRQEARDRGLDLRKAGTSYGLETSHGTLMRTNLRDVLELVRLPPGVLATVTR